MTDKEVIATQELASILNSYYESGKIDDYEFIVNPREVEIGFIFKDDDYSFLSEELDSIEDCVRTATNKLLELVQ